MYLSTKNKYKYIGEKAANELALRFKGYGDFRTFSSHCIEDGYKILKPILSQMVNDLVQSGHYDLSTEIILSKYGEEIFASWRYVEEQIAELCKKRDIQIAETKEYRELRKASRGRMVGGGFGLSGAIKGAATAGMFNLFTGVLHSGVNAIGNSFTRVAMEKELNQIYNSPDMLDGVRQGIQICVESMGFIYLCYQGIELESFAIASEESKQRVAALQKNRFQIPEEERLDYAIKMLLLDPVDLKTYELLLKKYKDPKGVLFSLARTVGISDKEYETVVENACYPDCNAICKSLQTDVKTIQCADLADGLTLNRKKESVKAKCAGSLEELLKNYSYEKESHLFKKYIEQFDSIIDTYIESLRVREKAERTYQNIIFASKEEAERARDISRKVNILCGNAATKSSAEVWQCIVALKNLEEQAPKEIKEQISTSIEEMEQLYHKLNIKERTYQGKTFDSIEEKNQVQHDCEELYARQPLALSMTKTDLLNAYSILNSQTWAPFAAEKYLAELTAIEQKLNKNARHKICVILEALCCITFMLFAVTQKLLLVEQTPIDVLEMLSIIVGESEITADVGGEIVFFLLPTMVLSWTTIKQIFFEKESIIGVLFLWGVVFLFLMGLYSFMYNSMDSIIRTTPIFKIATWSVLVLGGIFQFADPGDV